MTFSIVARDERGSTPEWGVAVASKFLAVGNVVSWARAGVGAIATQALANLAYGADGLSMLEQGSDAATAVTSLTQADGEREQRQLGIVDRAGRPATFTGAECFDWAGGRTGEGYCCQGNILAGPGVVDTLAETFEATEGEFAVRLLAALLAADRAGGDRRGRQSAAILIVREGGGYGGGSDKAVDLRVDDHLDPIPELQRLFSLHRLYFPRPEDLEFIDVDPDVAGELRNLLSRLGYKAGTGAGAYDDALKKALYGYVGTENLEERWSDEAMVELSVLEHLRAKARD
ncbi:MAG: hypothetical protein QOH48_1775 [Actinomycetota bacterium]|jgi:uncharacterized Ntn-hydrolase superfamily protein|nr:hypothetical protein [Actinomycetota bacterium]